MTWKPLTSEYPWLAYPGFRSPEDWRTAPSAEEEPNDRVRQIVAEASADHGAKHEHHEHPFCPRCRYRAENFADQLDGEAARLSHAALSKRYREALAEFGLKQVDVDPLLQKLQRPIQQLGCVDAHLVQRTAEQTGFDASVVKIVAEFIDDVATVNRDHQQADQTCIDRVRRYLLLHRNLPDDTLNLSGTLSLDLVDRAELANLPTLAPLIEDTITQHAYVLLGGRRSTWKSFAAVDWAACIATGKPWQSRPVQQGRVLYVAGEGAYGMHARLSAWEKAWQTPIPAEAFTTLRRPVNLFRNVAESDELVRIVAEGGYRFVVLDTLHKMSSGADGDRTRDMGPVLEVVERIKHATKDGSVLVIAHTEATDQKVRGSTSIEDDADIIYRTRVDNDGVLRLWRDKNKDGPLDDEISLRLSVVDLPELETTSCVLESHIETRALEVSDNEQHVLATMIEAFSETGATAAELREASGLPRSSFYRALNHLVRETHVVNVGTKNKPRYELSSDVQSTHNTESRSESSESSAVPSVSQSSRPCPVQSHTHKGWDVGRDGETEPLDLDRQEVAS